MELSKTQLESFIDLFERRFGRQLNNQEALEKAQSLLSMMRIVYSPLTKRDMEKVEKRQIIINNKYDRQKNAT